MLSIEVSVLMRVTIVPQARTPHVSVASTTSPRARAAGTLSDAFFQMMSASLRRVSGGAEIHLLTLDSCAVPGGLGCDLIFRRPSKSAIEATFEKLMAEEAES